MTNTHSIYLSVVIPVYNEEPCLKSLYSRLINALDGIRKPYEIIFINDGSQDDSAAILREFYNQLPHCMRVIEFNGNFGQHMAIMAGFEYARGEIIINLDADLQNPPEEIPRFLAKYEEGYDYVGSIRDKRKDSYLLRTLPSKLLNKLRSKVTDIHITDQGCMMRAYSRRIVELIKQCSESSTFITALGYKFAINPTEIVIRHDVRREGESKYGLRLLMRVTFDLFTGFSTVPLHIFTVFGLLTTVFSALAVAYMTVRKLVIGPEADGFSILFAILCFLMGVTITGTGIVGEYIGRIYEVVRKRPRFLIKKILEKSSTQQEKEP